MLGSRPGRTYQLSQQRVIAGIMISCKHTGTRIQALHQAHASGMVQVL